MTSQIAQPLSRNDIRDFTYNLRKAIGVEDKPYFPIMRFLELLLPQLDEKFELQIYSEQEMGDAHGLTYPEQHVIRLRRDVYDSACDGKGRDRFTVAHEVGHYFLHTPARIVLAKLEQGTSVPEYMNPEWQGGVCRRTASSRKSDEGSSPGNHCRAMWGLIVSSPLSVRKNVNKKESHCNGSLL